MSEFEERTEQMEPENETEPEEEMEQPKPEEEMEQPEPEEEMKKPEPEEAEARAVSAGLKKKEKETPKAHTVRFIIILLLSAVVILGVYLHLTNQSKNSDRQAEENMTETEVLKQYDLVNDYPKQMRDVVKLHCRYLKCMYNENLSQEELELLNAQTRELYSQILLEENNESEQFAALLGDIDAFHSAGKIFVSYSVDTEEHVQYSSIDGVEYAMVRATCNIKEGAGTSALQEEYLLVKEDDQWKILGWQEITTD